MSRFGRWAWIAGGLIWGSVFLAEAVEYVDRDATGGGNTGGDWANAFTNLEDALNTGTDDEIWVAEGVYVTASGFALKNHDLYGGFAGTESQRTERNPATHLTILQASAATQILVKATGNTGLATLDGFTVCNGAPAPGSHGAGLYMADGYATIANCIFSNNVTTGTGAGGGIYMGSGGDGTLTISNCAFRGNLGYAGGGDVYVAAMAHTTSVSFCTFQGSSASNSAGSLYLAHTRNSLIVDCTFSNITSLGSGGAIYRTCNTVITNTVRRVSFRNVRIASGSTSDYAGGAVWLSVGAGGKHILDTCSFEDTANLRTDQANGGAVHIARGVVDLWNCGFTNTTAKGNPGHGGAVSILGTDADSIIISNCSFQATTNGTAGWGGGVYLLGRAAPVTIVDSTFRSCTSARHGGAIYIRGHASYPIQVARCSFFSNRVTATDYDGGALYLNDGAGGSRVVNSVFAYNSAADYGGAVFDSNGVNTLYLHCTFYTNSAKYGGGLRKDAGLASVTNTIFWRNHATTANHEELSADAVATVSLDYCNADVSRMTGVDSTAHLLNLNPAFWAPAEFDFRITPASPMRNAGLFLEDVRDDREGNERSGLVDIGAYELSLQTQGLMIQVL